MNRSIIPLSSGLIPGEKTTWLVKFARRLVHAQFAKLKIGEIVFREQHNEYYFGKTTDEFPTPVFIDIHHASVYIDVAFGGSSGSGEAYMKGAWTCSDLVTLVRIFLRNRHVLDNMDYRITRIRQPFHKLVHSLSRNTRNGSRSNISAHYDIGNDLFQTFLDPTMMYSSAYFERDDMTLEQASVAKLDLICQKLQLKPEDHVLEIGTGWGGFAIHAAKYYGCRVTTTTISEQQYRLAHEKVRAEGLAHQIDVLKQDYRDLSGEYDKLVSIEMIEAIGHQYMNTYFRQCSRLLKANGMMLLQAITITDSLYASALKDVDFIKKYIFPGGFLPSVSAMCSAIAKKTNMKLFHMQDIGPHYAQTLHNWRQRFSENIDRIKSLGYPEEFIRLWDYYFCYCEGGFLERDIGTVQMLLTKPECRRQPVQI